MRAPLLKDMMDVQEVEDTHSGDSENRPMGSSNLWYMLWVTIVAVCVALSYFSGIYSQLPARTGESQPAKNYRWDKAPETGTQPPAQTPA